MQTGSDRHEYASGNNPTPLWSNDSMDGPVTTLVIPTAGEHTINLWVREDGVIVDRFLLTLDAAFTPTGDGPAESPRVPPSELSGTVWDELNGDGTRDAGEPGLAGVTILSR